MRLSHQLWLLATLLLLVLPAQQHLGVRAQSTTSTTTAAGNAAGSNITDPFAADALSSPDPTASSPDPFAADATATDAAASAAADNTTDPFAMDAVASPSPDPTTAASGSGADATTTASPSPPDSSSSAVSSPSPPATTSTPAATTTATGPVLLKAILRITGSGMFPLMTIDSFVDVMGSITGIAWDFRVQQAYSKDHPWPTTAVAAASQTNCTQYYCPTGGASSSSSSRRRLAAAVALPTLPSAGVLHAAMGTGRKLLQATASPSPAANAASSAASTPSTSAGSSATCGTSLTNAPKGEDALAAGCTAATHFVVCGTGAEGEANCLSVCKGKTTSDGTKVYDSISSGNSCCRCLFNGGTPLIAGGGSSSSNSSSSTSSPSPSPSSSSSSSASPNPSSSSASSATASPSPRPSPSPSPAAATVVDTTVWYVPGFYNGSAPPSAGVFIMMDAMVDPSQLDSVTASIKTANETDALFKDLQRLGWNNISSATIIYAAVPIPDFSGWAAPEDLKNLTSLASANAAYYASGFKVPGISADEESPNAPPEQGGTSVGLIVGIIAGVVGAVLIVTLIWVVVASRRRKAKAAGGSSGADLAKKWSLERDLAESRQRELARQESRERWSAERDAQKRAESISSARSMGSKSFDWASKSPSYKMTRADTLRMQLGLPK